VSLLWTAPARGDLAALVRYIANDDVDAASRVEDRIVAAVKRLSEMPNMGRLGQLRGTRELVVARTAYLAIYRI
jgi:toxin ParE1/3/4